ncbi:MAG: IseA DL-endopeptidase inhibitor family protein [Lachnospiraceae bacterium]|nr:IseA DL-endopeptidase inhibitor family protein [Ruminococcus sp.]MCM1275747.1 IseA DL-endopeptidase inhibitor family protein [Lachnospiraceae bacterium]
MSKMTDAFENISDRHIIEFAFAEPPKRIVPLWAKIGATAASIAIIGLTAADIAVRVNTNINVVSEPYTSVDSAPSESSSSSGVSSAWSVPEGIVIPSEFNSDDLFVQKILQRQASSAVECAQTWFRGMLDAYEVSALMALNFETTNAPQFYYKVFGNFPQTTEEMEKHLKKYFTSAATAQFMTNVGKGTLTVGGDGSLNVEMSGGGSPTRFIEIDGRMYCSESTSGFLLGEPYWSTAKAVSRSEDTLVFTYIYASFGELWEGEGVLKKEDGDWKFESCSPWLDEPKPLPVDIGNGMTLTGTPLDSSELEEFSIDPVTLGETEEAFFGSLGDPELGELFQKAQSLFWFCHSPGDLRLTAAVYSDDRFVPYIDFDSSKYLERCRETGYTYESFYNAFREVFTEEEIDRLFEYRGGFLNYNGELFCTDGASGGNAWEVHREYELVPTDGERIVFRRTEFMHDIDFYPSQEWDPELRYEYRTNVFTFAFVPTEDGWRLECVSEFDADRIYPDDELVPSGWLPVGSCAEVEKNAREVLTADFSSKDPESALPALMNRHVFFYMLSEFAARALVDIDFSAPYSSPDFESPVYPMTSEYISDVQSIYDLAYGTYESSLAEKRLHGLNGEPLYAEIDGQMYVNYAAFPAGAGGASTFIARSYVEITEKTDNKCTFIWHYPDVERLNPPEEGYEFHYYERSYTAEYIEGSWKLNEVVSNLG